MRMTVDHGKTASATIRIEIEVPAADLANAPDEIVKPLRASQGTMWDLLDACSLLARGIAEEKIRRG